MIILGDLSIDPKNLCAVHTDGEMIWLSMADGNEVEVRFPSALSYSDIIKTAEAIYLAVSQTKGEPVSTLINLNW